MKSHKWRAIIGMDYEKSQMEEVLMERQTGLESNHTGEVRYRRNLHDD